jgi:hypothetical protein
MSVEDLFPFSWSVPYHGYQWWSPRSAQSNEEPSPSAQTEDTTRWLCEAPSLNTGPLRLNRVYEPLQRHPSLFCTFAETSSDEEGILAFANVYGWLGLAERIPGTSPWRFGEPLFIWQQEIRAMRKTLELWEALQAGDRARLVQSMQVLVHQREGRYESIEYG